MVPHSHLRRILTRVLLELRWSGKIYGFMSFRLNCIFENSLYLDACFKCFLAPPMLMLQLIADMIPSGWNSCASYDRTSIL